MPSWLHGNGSQGLSYRYYFTSQGTSFGVNFFYYGARVLGVQSFGVKVFQILSAMIIRGWGRLMVLGLLLAPSLPCAAAAIAERTL